MKQRVFNILISFVVFGLGVIVFSDHLHKGEPPEKVNIIKLEQPEFLLSDSPEKDLIKALNYYDVKHPEIVYAQAVLETGHFRSKICKNYNNLFGLYNSRTKNYYKFNHWTESIIAYLNYIQYKYKPPNDYYKFLTDIGYAEDPEYINKLKRIVSRYDKRRSTKYLSGRSK